MFLESKKRFALVHAGQLVLVHISAEISDCSKFSPHIEWASNIDSGMVSRVFLCVASKSTGQATPAFTAASQVPAQTHHWSPALSPGKPYCGAGVMRSFPDSLAKFRNSSVKLAQTVWRPKSRLSVLQHPSLYHPVRGLVEQLCSL